MPYLQARRAAHRPRDAAGRGSRRAERARSTATRTRSTATASSPARCCSPPATSRTRRHRSNAQRAMERLLGLRILPIVNENDTVATHEIRFGDNDRLAALVAELDRRRRARAAQRHRRASTRGRPTSPGAPTASRTCAFGDDLHGVEFGSVGRATASAPGERRPRSPPRAWPRHPESACSSRAPTSSAQALAGAEIGTWFDAASRAVAPPPTGPIRARLG